MYLNFLGRHDRCGSVGKSVGFVIRIMCVRTSLWAHVYMKFIVKAIVSINLENKRFNVIVVHKNEQLPRPSKNIQPKSCPVYLV